MSARPLHLALSAGLLSLAVTHADPPKEAAFKYLSPKEAIAKMKYPEGFVVNAFAAEPDCQQPFAFTFTIIPSFLLFCLPHADIPNGKVGVGG